MSTDATRCFVCGGAFSTKRVIIDGRAGHVGCVVMSYPPHTPDDAARMTNEIGRLREAIEKATAIIDRNLYHQREKCEDGIAILRRALLEE